MRVFGNFDMFNNFSLLIRGIVFILSNYYFTIDRKRTSIIKLKPITKTDDLKRFHIFDMVTIVVI